MGGVSKATKKKIAHLRKANERRRLLSLQKKHGSQLTLTTNQTEDSTDEVSTVAKEPVSIIVKQEEESDNDNVLGDEEDNQSDDKDERVASEEDPDWTPPQSPLSPPCSQEKPPTSSGSLTSQLTSLPKAVNFLVTNCLFCDRLRKYADWTPLHNYSMTEANFQVYFILRKMLNVQKDKLMDYLVQFGEPRKWIIICRDCVSIVDKAVRLQRQITRLEEKLRECQNEMKDKIIKSIKVNRSKNLISGNINKVTRETRELISRNGQPNKVKASTDFGDNQKTFAVAISSAVAPEGTTSEYQTVKLVNCQFEEYSEEEDKQDEETSRVQVQSISYNYSHDEEDIETESESGSESESNSLCDDVASISKPSDNDEDNHGNLDSDDDNSLGNYQIVITSEARENEKMDIDTDTINQSAAKVPSTWKLIRKDYECFKEGAYCCPMCVDDKHSNNAGVGIMSLEKFISHMIFHKKRPLKCTECGCHYSNLEELKKKNRLCADRLRRKTDNHFCSANTVIIQMPDKFDPGKIWKCHGQGNGCLSTFNFETDRDNHQEICEHFKNCQKTLETKRKFECQICRDEGNPEKKSYNNLSEWALHRCLSHGDKASQSCLYCNQIFAIKTKEGIDLPNYFALRVHMQKNHSPASLRRSPDVCEFCGGVFLNTLEFHDHLTEIHKFVKSTAYSCEICYLRNSQRCAVRKHINLMHSIKGKILPRGDDAAEGEEESHLICEICGHKVLRNYLMTFLDHKLVQHGIMPGETGDEEGYRKRIRQCDKEGCGFKSLYERKVRVHGMKMHGGERDLKCQFCGKGFLYPGKLRDHEEIHKNKQVKPYQCEICGNRFAVKNYLYIHMRLSHQNRPFASTNRKRKRK